MDANDVWQQNKRFIVTVASGVIVFVIGSMLVNSFFRDELVAQRRSADSASKKLRSEPMYSSDDLATAQKENEELKRVLELLRGAVAFTARPAFSFDAAKGSASNQYFAAVSNVREDLLTLAGRGNLRLQEDLGLPALSPTRENEIVRYLEALDLIDRTVHLALATGVERIDKIEIKLDPKLASRDGVGDLERTRVSFALSGRATPMVAFLEASQRPAASGVNAAAAASNLNGGGGAKAAAGSNGKADAAAQNVKPLLLEKADMRPARAAGADEALLEVTFVVARLKDV